MGPGGVDRVFMYFAGKYTDTRLTPSFPQNAVHVTPPLALAG
jgi:hypothetical protein